MKKFIKKSLVLIGTIITIIFFVPLFHGIFNIGNQFGMCVGLLFMVCGVFLDKIKNAIKKLCQKKPGKVFVYAFSSLIIVFACFFTITFGYVCVNAAPPKSVSGTVIILGCQVRGTVPSLQLYDRTVTAGNLMKESNCVAVLAGGQGFDEDISEAQCMHNVLTDMGISPYRLYLEDKSTSTDENLRFSKKVIEENGLDKNACIISSNYHIARAKMMAKKIGFYSVCAYPAPTKAYAFPTYAVREVFAIWYLLIFG